MLIFYDAKENVKLTCFLRYEFQNVVQSLCKSVVQKIMHKIT